MATRPVKTPSSPLVVLTFTKERETKGAVRYQEVKENDLAEGVVGTLYVRKSAFAARGSIPDQITVKLEF